MGPAYPIVYSDVYAYSYPPPYAYTPAPNVVVVVPPAAPPPEVRYRREPAEPDIQEIDDRYWQRRRESAARAPEQISFRLALKDGTIETGVAYWVEGESLHYITTQGRHKEIPLGEVDREASERLNRNGQIEFKLPPARD